MDYDEAYQVAAELLSGVDLSRDEGEMLANIRANQVSIGVPVDCHELDTLIHEATRDPVAWDACMLLIERCHQKRTELPRALIRFHGWIIRPNEKPGEKRERPKPKGRPKNNTFRDFMIVAAIDSLHKSGIQPYRNNASDAFCGISIVRDVLKHKNPIHADEEAIAKVWQNRAKVVAAYTGKT